MSKVYQVAAEMVALLEGHAALDGVPWHVDRQGNIEQHISKAILKAKTGTVQGVVGVILFAGTQRVAKRRFLATYVVELWGRSTLQGADNALDDLDEELWLALDGARISAAALANSAAPALQQAHCYEEMEIGSTTVLLSTKYDRHATEARVAIQL